MDDVWPWLASISSNSDETLLQSLPLAVSPDGACIVLQTDSTATVAATEQAQLVTFSLVIHGTNGAAPASALWTSDAFPSSSPPAVRLQLLVQFLDEAIALSPFTPCLSTDIGEASAAKLNAEVVSSVVEKAGGDGPSAATAFFSVALLLRLFWLCALDAPADSGFLFFRVLGSEIERALGCCRPALGVFLRSVGPDIEDRFMRSLGYMLAKWCLLREIETGSAKPAKPEEFRRALPAACFSYAAEIHGLWVLKGYAPVLAMRRVATGSSSMVALPHEAPEEPALRYGLVHQQLEAVAQLEYAVTTHDARFIRIAVRIDNIRIRVVRLGFRSNDNVDAADAADERAMDSECHFPSRVILWVGPRFGASYAAGPSLGRSTGNPERDVEMTRTIKGAFPPGPTKGSADGGGGTPRVKAKMRSSARARNRSWRWEQEAEGSSVTFEGVLCDPVTGTEVSAWRNGGGGAAEPRNGLRRRYGGPGRAFSKMRGLVVAGDELPEEVTWRVGRGLEGTTVRWRVGLKVWVSYLPNEVRSAHFETRCVEWAQEVDLPVVANGAES